MNLHCMHIHVLYFNQYFICRHVWSLNCSIAVSNLTAEWIDNTTLRVKWEPVQVTNGVSLAYSVDYSAIIRNADGVQCVSEANGTEFQMSKTTKRAFVAIDNLHPSLFYNIRVKVQVVHLNHDQFQDSSVAIGE